MKLTILFFLFHGIKLYLIGNTFSYILINSNNYTLELVPYNSVLYSEIDNNHISEINSLFYYLSPNDKNWKNIITKYRNSHFVLYLENIDTFNAYYPEIEKQNRINIIIIGVESNFDKSSLKYKEDNKYIFINKDKIKIKNNFNTFSLHTICSVYINFYYAGDIFADDFVKYVFIFIIIYILIYSIICYDARKNNKHLFIQDYILVTLFFYFFHTLLLYIFSSKKRYKCFDDDIYSGVFYIIFNCFQFFIKLLPCIFTSIQINVFEVREHSVILGNSKIIHFLCCNIFFIISLQNDNTRLSEFLNNLLYTINLIGLLCMFFDYIKLFQDKYLESIENEPDYLITLNIKKNLFIIHFISVTLFVITHVMWYFIMQYFLDEYRTIKFSFIFINYSDLFLVLIITIVHFPRKLPPNYIEEYRDPFDEPGNNNIEENNSFKYIYNLAYKQINEDEYFQNYKKDESSNIVLIENPFNENKLEEFDFEKKETEEKDENNNKKNEVEKNNEENEVDENQILIEKENKENKGDFNDIEKEILDLTHTKLGFIDFSL